MKLLAINGSPRKKWNTAMLLEKSLEGAVSQGAETELVHLYDLNYKGCISCFACKIRGGKSYGKCAVQDDLTPVLHKVKNVDALILGSPIYFTTVTGEMRSFVERLFFPYHTYTDPPQSLFPRKINTGIIYTMGVTEDLMVKFNYEKHLSRNEMFMQRIFGASESLFSFDTYQFDDYSKYVADRFDPEQKAKRRKEIFPLDCQKAFDMGVRFAKGKG
jgi:multimeric flavodoxin WrbA